MPPPTATIEFTSTTTSTLELLLPTGEQQSVWKGIPVMPGAISGAEREGAYYYTVKVSQKAVQDYYTRELSKVGYSSFAVGTGKNGSSLMLMYQKGDKTLVISVLKVKEFTVVMIMEPY
jgi:hypothetical protein